MNLYDDIYDSSPNLYDDMDGFEESYEPNLYDDIESYDEDTTPNLYDGVYDESYEPNLYDDVIDESIHDVINLNARTKEGPYGGKGTGSFLAAQKSMDKNGDHSFKSYNAKGKLFDKHQAYLNRSTPIDNRGDHIENKYTGKRWSNTGSDWTYASGKHRKDEKGRLINGHHRLPNLSPTRPGKFTLGSFSSPESYHKTKHILSKVQSKNESYDPYDEATEGISLSTKKLLSAGGHNSSDLNAVKPNAEYSDLYDKRFIGDGEDPETSRYNVPAILAAKTAGGAPFDQTLSNGINRASADVFHLKKLRDDEGMNG